VADELFRRRVAHRALVMVLDQYGLTGITRKFNPDDPAEVFAGLRPGEVAFFEDFRDGIGKALAIVLLDGTRGRVIVDRVERLVRPRRQREFRTEDVGIRHQRGAPDIDVEVGLADLLEAEGELLRSARQRPAAPRSRPGPVQVEHAIGGRW
jgi:hypothetical protein